jgi:hypothetical protein
MPFGDVAQIDRLSSPESVHSSQQQRTDAEGKKLSHGIAFLISCERLGGCAQQFVGQSF